MPVNRPSIYISHAWGGKSEEVVHEILNKFQKEGLEITFDKKDLGYRESITRFMEKLGEADAIIMVISNKYLHSEYCMFELLQIYDNKNILDRIFPIVLDEVNIAKSTDRLELVKYWEDQSNNLEIKMRELQSLSNIEGIGEDLNLYYNIRSKIAKLTSILKDINTLNIQTHQDADYTQLVNAVKNQLANKKDAINISDDNEMHLRDRLRTGIAEKNQNKGKVDNDYLLKLLKWLAVITLVIIAGYLLRNFIFHNINGDISTPGKAVPDSSSLTEDINTDKPLQNLEHDKSNALLPVDKSQEEHGNKNGNLSSDKVGTEPVKTQINSERINNNPATKVEIDEAGSMQSNTITKEDYEHRNLKTVIIASQYIEVILQENISSNSAKEGAAIYLLNSSEVKSGNDIIIPKGAMVKAVINRAIPSENGSVGELSFSILSVKGVNDEWFSLRYPDISKKERNEIIFNKGMKISKIKLPSFTTKID